MSTQPRFLTQNQAKQRFSQIEQNSIKYTLFLNYLKGESFEGLVEIKFNLVHNQENLFFDFRTTKIHSFYVNNQKVEQPNNDGLFLHLDKSLLLVGQNTVQVYYSTKYADDGNGLHSFIDTDGKQYLYSQCEAYSCNKIFPCFDQPDLKATLTFVSSFPSDWVSLFNENETKLIKNQTSEQCKQLITVKQIPELDQFLNCLQENVAVYPETKILPTYLFGFIAGPFAKIDTNQATHKNLPMALYCRESLKQYLQNYAEFIFEVTNQCMAFYEDYFQTPYYFNKYDQIFCPEFNAGAMENAGLVTFNDRYVFREEVDASRLTGFTNTITHEMAHHWFGNLVTMKWWNGLWLNESFADFISHYCISKLNIKTRPLSNVWLTFNLRKAWGYRTDQLNTTHPIEGEVPDTEAAENIFDGITYSKGAATLRQLMCLIGEEKFGQAMGIYFNKFAWKNTELSDFIDCLQTQFQTIGLNFTLQEWKAEWIEKAGLNEIQPLFNPNDHSNQAILQIKMTPALIEHPTLRRHKIQIAFFKEDGTMHIQDTILLGQEINNVIYDGTQNFKAVMLNYGDQSFVKLLLDDSSLEFYKEKLHLIKDELTRTLIWRSFFDMARDGKLSSEEYIEIFTQAIVHETSDENIKTQYLYIESSLINLTPNKFQEQLSKRLFDFTLKMLLQTDPSNTNKMFILRDKLISFARDSNSIRVLVSWYNKTHQELLKYPLGLENQWSIVSKVNKKKEFTNQEKDAILQNQEQIDPSDNAKLIAIKCLAYRADNTELARLWKEFINPNLENPTMSVKTLDYCQLGFNNSDNLDLLQPYYEQWWEQVLQVFANQPTERGKSFYNNLYPRTDDIDYLENKLQMLLTKCQAEQITLKKLINESIDDTQRKRKCYQCFYQRAKLAQKANL